MPDHSPGSPGGPSPESNPAGAPQSAEPEARYRTDGGTLLPTPDFATVTNDIVAAVAQIMGATMCTLRLVDEGKGYLTLAAAYGISDAYLQGWQQVYGGRQRVGEGIAGWSVLTGQPAAVRDVFLDPRLERTYELNRSMGYRSMLSAPVALNDRILGALTVGYAEVQEFSDLDVGRLARLGSRFALTIENARQAVHLRTLTEEITVALAEATGQRDPYTGSHCERVGTLSWAMAESLGLSESDREQMRFAAILHDVGKIVVPDTILLKPGPLTPEEWVVMRNHVLIGEQIVRKVSLLEPMAPIIYHHHERYDGAGYLEGLAGARIPLGSRIIAVVDAFDAMTNDRPYRKALPRAAALAELLRHAGTQFDPALVEVFRRSVYPHLPG